MSTSFEQAMATTTPAGLDCIAVTAARVSAPTVMPLDGVHEGRGALGAGRRTIAGTA